MQLFKNQAGISDIFSKDVTFRDIFSQPLRMKKHNCSLQLKGYMFSTIKSYVFLFKITVYIEKLWLFIYVSFQYIYVLFQ